jgi:aryl-alcohol dehydrogenase-like predicted oxidoreductase
MADEAKRDGVDRRSFLKTVAVGAVGVGLAGAGARPLFAQEEEEEPAADRVKNREYGRTKIPGSLIVFGGVPLRPEHLPLLNEAHERGVNVFDVASGYGGGLAETAIGQLNDATGDRESYYILTKASGFRPPSGTGKEVYQALRDHLIASLTRMKTDYVDVLFWPHGASSTEFLKDERMKDAMRKLREEELVRFFGVSSHSNYVEVGEAVIKDGFYDMLMPVANVCTQNPEKVGGFSRPARRGQRGPLDTRKMLELAKEKNVGVIAMKCAQHRFLTANAEDLVNAEFPDDSTWSKHQKLYAYMLGQPGVSSVVVGITSIRHLREALEVGCA